MLKAYSWLFFVLFGVAQAYGLHRPSGDTLKVVPAPDSLLSSTDSVQPITPIFYSDENADEYRKYVIQTLFPEQKVEPETHPDVAVCEEEDWENSDSIFAARLALLDAETDLALEYNDRVKNFIRLYALQRKEQVSRMLSLSEYYFPMYGKYLEKYDLPQELKYLSIVESALVAKARSRAAAVGLWQFIYSTGKLYGLDVNSHIDERSDPEKATDAACRYLKNLHKIYNNWELALAAYNCGPGNVNKAIRRSGGKRNFWQCYRYLPRETRGYVPAFIAVNYVMNYHLEHGLYPKQERILPDEVTTVFVDKNMSFEHISALTHESVEVLEFLNPALKTKVIPGAHTPMDFVIPKDKELLFTSCVDSISALGGEEVEKSAVLKVVPSKTYHYVRSGETLSHIARRYGTSVRNVMAWNNLRSTRIHVRQRLVIRKGYETTVVPSKNLAQNKAASQPKNGEYHVVQRGDTLWSIASRYHGVSADDLKKINNITNASRLKIGQKIKVTKGV